MTTKIKTTLLTAISIFCLHVSLHAQDKFEFAVVRQINYTEITISIEGKAFETEKLPKDIRSVTDNSYLLMKIAKLQQEGWEVFSTTETQYTGLCTTFFLRRKIH